MVKSGEKGIITIESNGLKLIQFDILNKYCNDIIHCFTTRYGGVSTGECSALNLGFNRNDTRENVLENFNRVAGAIGTNIKNMVLSNQVHDSRVRVITGEDRGKGLLKENDIIGFDALVTNEPGVALVTFYADCVPVFLYDPVKRAIGLAHSGWRGTVKEIAAAAIRQLGESYHSNPEDIIAVIGPSIGKCCFEVDRDVKDEFVQGLDWSSVYCSELQGKWKIDLQGIICNTIKLNGVKEKNIFNSCICTMCNKDLFFSHRGSKGKTGSLAAVMQLIDKTKA